MPRTARIGTRLRLKGQGLPRGPGPAGDLYVLLRDARTPPEMEQELFEDTPAEIDPRTALCSYCGDLLVTARFVICPRCLSPCHWDCFEANERRCIRFACVASKGRP